ncbi:hypothetical protein PAPYR_13525 [Paratrimastix pyriformis]|uniref:Uncharacterized protein n=1 Tax=Paratrimastix pyriformis TaxID=342808 RepID=A0ABQ8U6F4_9EUKA|nr:hypothetical protein PAPYR_13525 [Paratrimastix pyriformis]
MQLLSTTTALPGGGRPLVPARVLRLMNVLHFPEPADDGGMRAIFSYIVQVSSLASLPPALGLFQRRLSRDPAARR